MTPDRGEALPRTATTIPDPLRPTPYLWVLGALWLLPLVLLLGSQLVLPHDNPSGQCEGIGFGCTLTPADTALFLALLAGPFLLLAGVVGIVVVALVQTLRRRRALTGRTTHGAGGGAGT